MKKEITRKVEVSYCIEYQDTVVDEVTLRRLLTQAANRTEVALLNMFRDTLRDVADLIESSGIKARIVE